MTLGQVLLHLAARRHVPMSFAPHHFEPIVFVPPLPPLHLVPKRAPGPDLSVGFPTHGHLSSPFGMRGHHAHKGMDIAAPLGSPVWSMAVGTVSSVRFRQGYGLTVLIDHGDGRQTLYAHLGATIVHAGDEVVHGTVIGQVGMTGRSTGPHVHFELRKNGVAVDPGLG